jgi:hypothetical protein
MLIQPVKMMAITLGTVVNWKSPITSGVPAISLRMCARQRQPKSTPATLKPTICDFMRPPFQVSNFRFLISDAKFKPHSAIGNLESGIKSSWIIVIARRSHVDKIIRSGSEPNALGCQ